MVDRYEVVFDDVEGEVVALDVLDGDYVLFDDYESLAQEKAELLEKLDHLKVLIEDFNWEVDKIRV